MKTSIAALPWLLAIFLFLTITPIFAQDIPVATPAVPVGPTTTITFEEIKSDFGVVKEGEIVSHTFTFTNTGDQPLILSDAKGSCGCTVPQWPKYPIGVGETASITVEFNSKNKKGRRNQKVTITANTNPPQNFIYLTGDIIPSEGTVEPTFSFPELDSNSKEDQNCFAIYPNPTAEILTLEMGENIGQDAIVTILSQSGHLMARREIKAVNTTVEFQVDHYPAGTYIAHVLFADERQSRSACCTRIKLPLSLPASYSS